MGLLFLRKPLLLLAWVGSVWVERRGRGYVPVFWVGAVWKAD
jgi:hypothetical protein